MNFLKLFINLVIILFALSGFVSRSDAALQVMEPVPGEYVILDTITNLMWTQDACYQVSDDGWFGGLNHAGYTDWGLPTRSMFSNLYNTEGITHSTPDPFTNVLFSFQGVIGKWTSEIDQSFEWIWMFNFNTGQSFLELSDSTSRGCLWAVRDYNNDFDNDGDGYAEIAGDCDDTDPDVNPGETELPYNGKDDDCDPATLDDDFDSDGFPLANDCDDNDPSVNPGMIEVPYNGKDDDCNAATLDDDLDGDGYPLTSDCNDNDPTINPGITEIPYNGKDDDCNPATSDGDPTIGLFIDDNGNVGIGTPAPSQKLSIYGIIESITGGIKYPDGTVQTTASSGGGSGDITAVNAGAGLNGGGTNGSVTLSTDTNYLQRRVNSTCPANQAIKAINTDGTVTCENVAGGTGDITSVTAGTGLTGGGTSGDVTLNTDFAGTGSAATAAKSDHHHDSVYQKKYARVAVVTTSGGDYSDPFTAMNNIATWCPNPSASNPCLLKIMPGVYDIGSNNLFMQQYVDIEGSGENVTRIKGTTDALNAVIMGADNAEIRFITIESTGGGSYAFAIYNMGTSPKVTNVTVIATGANENVGILCDDNCSSEMTNLTSVVTGGSIAAIAVYIEGASPTLRNVSASAADSTRNIGVDINTYSLAELTNVKALASGGSKTEALLIQGTSSPILLNVKAFATGAISHNYAVYSIQASSPTLNNVTADASGVVSYGVYNNNFGLTGGTIRIDHSVVKGASDAVYLDATYSALIGNTRLGGSVSGPGNVTCIGAYDESYTALDSSCQ